MSVALFAILGPLAAAGMILAVRRTVTTFALLGVGVSLIAAVVSLVRVEDGKRFATAFSGLPEHPFRLVVDPLSALLATVVAVIATLIFVYAVGYMRAEADQVRFFAGMSFFVAAMQILVLAGDWVLFIFGWELIALASYLLIGFWFDRPGVGSAATRAFLTTRAADLGLYIGAFILIDRAGTTEIAATLDLDGRAATVAGLFLLLGAVGKSAQVPLHGWLQDAMVGPTPVSALLHSSTLVVAGVILLTRAFPLLSGDVRLIVGIVGGTTAVVTGLMAISQGDFKRMLASSTSGQLGFMLLGLGAGSVGAAVFHLVTNSAIKSGLFLGAGIFQHSRCSTDFDDLAGVGRERRRTYLAVAVLGLALAGVPPLAAFWSKDAIISATLDGSDAWLLASLAIAGSVLTAAYVARSLRLLWGNDGEPGVAPIPGMNWMIGALGVLAGLAVVLGVVAEPLADLLNVEIPESLAGVIAGLGAAILGLLAGWFGRSAVEPDRLRVLAGRGFRINGGFADLVVRPVLAVSQVGDRVDRAIHAGVLGVGHDARAIARIGNVLDFGVHRGVEIVGAFSLKIAAVTRIVDEAGIDGFIHDLVRTTRAMGVHARQLQTGFVHQEMLTAAVATIVVVALLFT